MTAQKELGVTSIRLVGAELLVSDSVLLVLFSNMGFSFIDSSRTPQDPSHSFPFYSSSVFPLLPFHSWLLSLIFVPASTVLQGHFGQARSFFPQCNQSVGSAYMFESVISKPKCCQKLEDVDSLNEENECKPQQG